MAETHFDEWIAERYQTLWPELFEPALLESTVSFLAALAGPGPALEFGVGTGRIAVPLSRRNVRVHGIELSPAMVARLHAHPDGAAVDVTLGDFATATAPGGPFDLTATPDHLGYESYDVATQTATSHHYWIVDGHLGILSSPHRYAWPSELDLMARLAGLTLRERWADWHRTTFTSSSRNHISTWEDPATPPQRIVQHRAAVLRRARTAAT